MPPIPTHNICMAIWLEVGRRLVGRPDQQFVIRQGGLAFMWCRTVGPKSPKHFPEETRPLSVGGGGDTQVVSGVAANLVRLPSKVFQARQHGDEVVRFCVIHGRRHPPSFPRCSHKSDRGSLFPVTDSFRNMRCSESTAMRALSRYASPVGLGSSLRRNRKVG